MPNYSLVVNSKFKPMSLQEMLIPFEKYGTAYKEQEEALAKLAADASVWNGMVDASKDKVAAQQLNKYNQDLINQRDAISTNGLDPSSRRTLFDLKARYASEVGSIEKAYEAREEERKAQQDAYIKSGGNVRYSKRADTDSLDNYLNGKRPEYLMFNLDDVMKESAVGAKAMSEKYFNTTEGKAFKGQYMNLIEERGLSPEQAAQVMENLAKENPEQYKEFNKFMDDLRTKYRTDQFNGNDQAAFNAAIRQGFNTGITYSRSNKPLQNGEYLSAADRFSQKMQEENLKLERERLGDLEANSGVQILPNGDIATKQGGNWVITDPESGEVKNITNTANLTKQISQMHKKPEGFEPIDFELDGDRIKPFEKGFHLTTNNYFSKKDAELVKDPRTELGEKPYANLLSRLADMNLSINDVDIYKDHDIASDDAYRIVYKGDDIDGNTPEKPAGNNTSSSGYDRSFAD